MSNSDSTQFDRLERDLQHALAWEPPLEVTLRVQQHVRSFPVSADSPRRGTWPRRNLRLVLLVVAGLSLMGASIALSLLQQAAQLMPGWQVAYERAETLNLSETANGYTVTLERGYVDPNQLVLGFVVTGPDGQTQAIPRGTVTDAAGRSYLDIAGGDIRAAIENTAATISSYQVPPGIGKEVTLTATFAELMPIKNVAAPAGPWVFHFTLPVHPAVVVEPDETVEAASIPITLRRLQATATAVRVQLDLDLTSVRSAQWSRWSMEGTLRQGDGPAQDLSWAPLPPAWTGQPKSEIEELIHASEAGAVMVRQTTAGPDTPSGSWTLTVDRLVGFDGQGARREVNGPWVFRINVP